MDSTEARGLNAGADLPALHQGAFTGPSAFADLIRNALAHADSQGWAEMVWSDATFEDWPLYEKAVVEACETRKAATTVATATTANTANMAVFLAGRDRSVPPPSGGKEPYPVLIPTTSKSHVLTLSFLPHFDQIMIWSIF